VTRTRVVLVLGMLLIMGLTACKEKAAPEGTGAQPEESTREYLSREKESVVKAAQERIERMEALWPQIQEKAAAAGDEAKVEFEKAKVRMGEELAEAKQKLAEARESGAETWETKGKPALNSAVERAQKFYEETASKLGFGGSDQ